MSNQGYFKLPGNSPEIATCEVAWIDTGAKQSFSLIVTYLLPEIINLGIFSPEKNKIK